jgi:hypothetical protein
MALNLTQRTGGGGMAGTRAILPTDSYRMRCIEAKMEDDTFAKPDRDGTLPQKLVLTFEVTTLTDEQEEIAQEREEEWDKVRIWHRFNPYYGVVREGGPSKFKEFLDNLVTWGVIPTLNLEAFEVESLTGIELKCSVVEYLKTMGVNQGQPGNKITGFAAVRNGKKTRNVPTPVSVAEVAPAATPIITDETLPF